MLISWGCDPEWSTGSLCAQQRWRAEGVDVRLSDTNLTRVRIPSSRPVSPGDLVSGAFSFARQHGDG